MKLVSALSLAILGAAVLTGPAVAQKSRKSEQPRPSVQYARTWDAAVEEAKLLNIPIVVHSHGFY